MCEDFLPQNQREERKTVFAGNTDQRVTSYLSSGKVGPHKKVQSNSFSSRIFPRKRCDEDIGGICGRPTQSRKADVTRPLGKRRTCEYMLQVA